MSHRFDIRIESVAPTGSVFVEAKRKYSVFVNRDGIASCTCKANSGFNRICKHIIEVNRLLKVLKGVKK